MMKVYGGDEHVWTTWRYLNSTHEHTISVFSGANFIFFVHRTVVFNIIFSYRLLFTRVHTLVFIRILTVEETNLSELEFFQKFQNKFQSSIVIYQF